MTDQSSHRSSTEADALSQPLGLNLGDLEQPSGSSAAEPTCPPSMPSAREPGWLDGLDQREYHDCSPELLLEMADWVFSRSADRAAIDQPWHPRMERCVKYLMMAATDRNVAAANIAKLKLLEASRPEPRAGDEFDCSVALEAWAVIEELKTKLQLEITRTADDRTPAAQGDQSDAGCTPAADPVDTRKAVWAGRHIYLGNDTAVSRLFWLLATRVGEARGLGEVMRAIDGFETHPDFGASDDEMKKARQRARRAISDLRERLREAHLDDHVLIVRQGAQDWPEYTMVWRFPR